MALAINMMNSDSWQNIYFINWQNLCGYSWCYWRWWWCCWCWCCWFCTRHKLKSWLNEEKIANSMTIKWYCTLVGLKTNCCWLNLIEINAFNLVSILRFFFSKKGRRNVCSFKHWKSNWIVYWINGWRGERERERARDRERDFHWFFSSVTTVHLKNFQPLYK